MSCHEKTGGQTLRAVWFLDLETETFSACSKSNVSTLKEGASPKPGERDMITKGTGKQKAL